MEVAERNMWVMEIKYFEFYLQILFLLLALRAKNDLVNQVLDNLRPFTKQVKNDKEKQ